VGSYVEKSDGSLQWDAEHTRFSTTETAREAILMHEILVIACQQPNTLTELLSLGNYNSLLNITLCHMGSNMKHWLTWTQNESSSTPQLSRTNNSDATSCSAFHFWSNPLEYYLTIGRCLVEFYHCELDSMINATNQKTVPEPPKGCIWLARLNPDHILSRAIKVSSDLG
jgi:hypothetical protein